MMASNGHGNPGSSILILYKVVNSDADSGDEALFNAFSMPRGPKGPTLAAVKQNCHALHGLSHLGPEGYHWRVCVEDKPFPGETTSRKTFSWWDVQDPNAKLPIKEASSSQLAKFFAPPRAKKEEDIADQATKAAKGAFKSLGKAMTTAVTGEHGVDSGPPVSVIAFKLLDLCKVHDDFVTKNHGRGGQLPSPSTPASAPRRAAPPPQQQNMRQSAAAGYQAPQPTPARQQQQQQQQRRAQQPQRSAAKQPQQPAAAANLMDFGAASAPASSSAGRTLNHTSSSPASFETRAERLKREYAQKQHTTKRVWDDIDQRWVEVEPKVANSAAASSGSMNGGGAGGGMNNRGSSTGGAKTMGISLDPANAVGKSANVQAAVNARVNEMRDSQAKALQEVREREEKKKKDEAEEDIVRRKLEPKIKAWSEEHGKKKQLRALLGTLHTILWAEANWKPVSLGDILDDNKCKRCFHKASRVVHPDKTHHLDAEKRFLAKRIFDSLSQAKTNFDNGAK